MADRRPIAKLRPLVAPAALRTVNPVVELQFSDARRASSAARGYGAEWRKRRQRILTRDNWCCVTCAKTGRVTPASEVDHVIPRAEGGDDSDSNLQSLCRTCHLEKTRSEVALRRLNGHSQR